MLSFSISGISVKVNPSFLLVAALIGLSGGDLVRVVIWVVVVFVSILAHELGHALTARSFGAEAAIELNAIGGLTSWSGDEAELTPGRRAAVAASGSLVGVALGGLVWVFARATGPHFGLVGFAVSNLILVNLFWGLLNWLPIRPLDGGHLLQSLLQKTIPTRAGRVANAVFFLTSAAALVVALRFRLFLVAIIAGWLLLAEVTGGRPRRPATALPPMTFDRVPHDEERPPHPSPDSPDPGEEDDAPV